MKHVITVHDIFFTSATIIGLIEAVIGLIIVSAGAVSDDPSQANRFGRNGCITFCIGAVICVLALRLLLVS